MSNQITDTIIEQLGGKSIDSAFAYCGAFQVGTDDENNLVRLHTNSFSDQQAWIIDIKYQLGKDLYLVTSYKKDGPYRDQKENLDGIFFDQLQSVVEALYDDMLAEYQAEDGGDDDEA